MTAYTQAASFAKPEELGVSLQNVRFLSSWASGYVCSIAEVLFWHTHL